MKMIYKYPIKITDRQAVKVPVESRIVHTGLDVNGTPSIWLEFKQEYKDILDPLTVYIFGTGHEIPDELKHVGSFSQSCFIWHLYID